MFHLKYPKKSNFFSWAELGCLARALGYKINIFREYITDDIHHTTEGVSLKELIKMIEYKLLQTVLHQTFNMHTADWNMCVIRKCLILLNHKALTFEEIHCIRLGYEVYEAIDMKGMVINKNVLLRAVKMCGRMISPLKLLHRVKHMRCDLDEKGRLQLYEFLDLILWCDLYEVFNTGHLDINNIKKNKLFQFVDFDRLLSHHDQRISDVLNQKFLQEEWDFGMEKLGSKKLFKDPTVHTEDSIRRTTYHKENYKNLKLEITSSQKQVHQAKGGYVRARPVTAPQLSHYQRKFDKPTMTERSVTETYKLVQRRLRSAPCSSSSRCLPERPKTSQYHRELTSPVVTCVDLTDFNHKKESLQFNITTVKTRSEEILYDDMDFIIPGYRDKLSKQPKPEIVETEAVEPKEKVKRDTKKIIEELSHPKSKHPHYHYKTCDARHRGWFAVDHNKGLNQILIDPPFNEGQNGYFTKQLQMDSDTNTPVNYVYRYTKKKQYRPMKGRPKYRPHTAPASASQSCLKSDDRKSIDNQSLNSTNTTELDNLLHKVQEKLQHIELEEYDPLKSKPHQESPTNITPPKNVSPLPTSPPGHQIIFSPTKSRSTPDSMSPTKSCSPQVSQATSPDKTKDMNFNFTSLVPHHKTVSLDLEYPAPIMRHTKPKIVEVGHIGRIKLLESIQESKYLEELLNETPVQSNKSQTTERSNSLDSEPTDRSYSLDNEPEKRSNSLDSKPTGRSSSLKCVQSESMKISSTTNMKPITGNSSEGTDFKSITVTSCDTSSQSNKTCDKKKPKSLKNDSAPISYSSENLHENKQFDKKSEKQTPDAVRSVDKVKKVNMAWENPSNNGANKHVKENTVPVGQETVESLNVTKMSCKELPSKKSSDEIRKSGCYKRLAERLDDSSSYVQKCLLSVGS